jgi:alkylation response protein AidB-like acyl-CoA dehydrogenase
MATALALEELAAGCLGFANLLGVHGLALTTLGTTEDLDRLAEIGRALARAEGEGRAHLLSTALTEPGAGSDMEDKELMRVGDLSSEARPHPGGYVLNGRKVFISNGNLAEQHAVIMPLDRRRPVETMWVFLVDRRTPGLTIARVEHKMGQKVCPAAELVFEDCFVPEHRRLGARPFAERGVEMVFGATRAAGGACGAGAARGAYERALVYAERHVLHGRPLVEHGWVRSRLSEMRSNAMHARGIYIEAMMMNEMFGLARLLDPMEIDRIARFIPKAVLDRVPPSRMSGLLFGLEDLADVPQAEVDLASGYGAAAKVTGSELGMRNCELALEIYGADGLRHDHAVEKLYRDARLLQIYEGTNQLNSAEVFQRLVGRDHRGG